MDHIDQIWRELNVPLAGKKLVIIDQLLSNDKNSQIQNRSVDHDSSSLTAALNVTSTVDDSSKEVLNLSNDILHWAGLEISEKSTACQVGDSDDDSEEDQEEEMHNHASCTNPKRPYWFKVQRIISLLRAPSKNDRMIALQAIERSIQNLTKKINVCPRPLEFPPPYDIASVTMKYQSGFISDLSARSWPHWNQSQVPLLSQFSTVDCATAHDGIQSHQNAQGNELQRLQAVYNAFGGELCHRLSDDSEQCRTLAIRCLDLFCLAEIRLEKHLHYLMRSILCKFQPIFHDETLNVFVTHEMDHEFFKRGGAVQRQDRSRLLHGESLILMKEISEEIRIQICHLISSMIRCSVHSSSLDSLDPYYVDIFLAVQSYLCDPFPDLKIVAASLLVQLLRIPQWESIAKHFAVALARAVIPNMRHRNTKVRLSAMDLFEAAISVPDRAKFKGAGTDAILDLLGYREENILHVAAFYKAECSVSVNALAEVSMDKNPTVRLRCCHMLRFILTCLPNRHEFHQRILPYMLVFHYDECVDIRTLSLSTVLLCGQQYETEHPDDIVERHQWGIDGDDRCNHLDPLPTPFTSRPNLGTRLFVRENTRRILEVTLKELSNWIENVRLASLKLLQVLVIYNEEHMTMNFHSTLDAITRAFQISLRDQKDDSSPFLQQLCENVKLIGRFVDPDVYLNLVLPRIVDISSETSICDGGFHPEMSRYSYALVLKSLTQGLSPHRLASHMRAIVATLLSDASVGHFTGSRVQIECLQIVIALLDRHDYMDVELSGDKVKIQNDDSGIAVTLNRSVDRLTHILQNSNGEQPEYVQIMVKRLLKAIELPI